MPSLEQPIRVTYSCTALPAHILYNHVNSHTCTCNLWKMGSSLAICVGRDALGSYYGVQISRGRASELPTLSPLYRHTSPSSIHTSSQRHVVQSSKLEEMGNRWPITTGGIHTLSEAMGRVWGGKSAFLCWFFFSIWHNSQPHASSYFARLVPLTWKALLLPSSLSRLVILQSCISDIDHRFTLGRCPGGIQWLTPG